MGVELYILGRARLPAHTTPWEMELENDEVAIDIWEETDAESCAFAAEASGVDFEPKSVVRIRRASEHASVVAEVIANAVGGVVFDDAEWAPDFNARVASPCKDLAELETRIHHAFENSEPFFERWEAEGFTRWKNQYDNDPQLREDNDWSDL